MANRVGQQLGDYRLVRLLGRGGFAEVYLGEHVHLDSNGDVTMESVQGAFLVGSSRLESSCLHQKTLILSYTYMHTHKARRATRHLEVSL